MSLAAFIALFAGIYVQKALGSDPTLGRKALASTTHRAVPRQKASVPSGSSGSAATSAQPSTATGSQPAVAAAPQPSPVTTSQS